MSRLKMLSQKCSCLVKTHTSKCVLIIQSIAQGSKPAQQEPSKTQKKKEQKNSAMSINTPTYHFKMCKGAFAPNSVIRIPASTDIFFWHEDFGFVCTLEWLELSKQFHYEL